MRFCFEGEFQGSVDDKIVVFGTFKNRSEWLLTKIGSNSDSSFLSAFMGRGDFCADSNEFYKTKMVFVCYDQLMFGRAFKILDVQFEGCSGVVTIGSSNLCKHPFFTPNTNYDEIICFHRSFADENVFGAAKELKKVEFVEY
ncbi:hypothetical protein MHBO_000367 [Bonamia ostreae]|uniref:Uncharacterized protein n=1 Tax=Bonamia ostreae TaxID=126728 RepID=A0ABV2AFD1_9EUKA